jgi:carboxymethylenebutenolidase
MHGFDADLRSLAGRVALSRREVVVTSLAAGFALAVQPVSAETIITDSSGLEAGEVAVPTGTDNVPGYRAMPATGGPFPVVLVVQEIFGVHEHIKDVCRRLAKLGYMAIAPELYARQGDVSQISDMQQIIRDVVSKVPDDQVMSDLDATVAFAKNSGKGDVTRLGITGFCWGGRIVWLYAARNPNLKAGVAWYGRLIGDPTPLGPRNPVDLAGDLKAPVLGLYGGADQGIPIATIEKMKQACETARKTCDFVVYPDTPHAFHADYRASYREQPAKDGWQRLQAWFKQHGVA